MKEIEIALALGNCRDFIRRWNEQERGLDKPIPAIADNDITTTLRRLQKLLSVAGPGQAVEIRRLVQVTEARLNSTHWRSRA